MMGEVMKQILWVLTIILATALSGCSGNNGGQQLFDTAKLEELQDNPEHARQLYQEIIDRYPETECARKAKERLSALSSSK
jgi:outer membrane protein assembly factor BamD (BamD/ComL family)